MTSQDSIVRLSNNREMPKNTRIYRNFAAQHIDAFGKSLFMLCRQPLSNSSAAICLDRLAAVKWAPFSSCING